MGAYRVQIVTEATAYVEVFVDGDSNDPEVRKTVEAEALNKASEIQLCYHCTGGDDTASDYTLELGEFDSVESVTLIGT